MSGEKRRWWLADVRFARIHRRLRKNYRAARARDKQAFEEDLTLAKMKFEKDRQALAANYARDLEVERAAAVKLAKEIARVRLEYGGHEFGRRFTLFATMDANFMTHARDLKDMSAYIIDNLAHMIKREFGQIDFTRMKPVVPRSYEEAKQGPKFYIDSGEALDSTGPR